MDYDVIRVSPGTSAGFRFVIDDVIDASSLYLNARCCHRYLEPMTALHRNSSILYTVDN